LHCAGGPQVPLLQAAPVPLGSLVQGVPFGAFGLEQLPVLVLQVPATWHWSDAVQAVAVPARQFPAPSQWSGVPVAPVQAFPSLQMVLTLE